MDKIKKINMMKRIFNGVMIVLAIVLIDFYWIIESNWHWIGIIGFFLMGWYWDLERGVYNLGGQSNG